MDNNTYPRTLGFECHNPDDFTGEARAWLERLRKEVRMTMPAENILRIEYPADIVRQIRTVNIDGMIYRLDFIDPNDEFWLIHCVFPNVPWNNREFMKSRFGRGKRTESEGMLTIEYPLP